MCGISGIFDHNRTVGQPLLQKMAATTRHRGPGHTGYYVSPDRRVGLAHNRLSIIDLSEAGNQPMVSADGKRWIVFNGEIYNFPNLRREMESCGRVFRSHSDTETLLELYGRKGEAALHELNGMFAFCIYDAEKRSLFLARDRLGIKPLYYVCRDGKFGFASEIKPLLCLRFVSKQLDPVALDAYFMLGYIPEDLCIFRNIRKLRPAHYAVFDLESRTVSLTRYWDLETRLEDLSGTPEPELLEMLEEKLRDAVRLRMISDVPIGSFLSGGLDSSLVTTLMAEEASDPIRTFNISFASGEYDESCYARIVAEHIGSRHTEHRVEMDAASALYHLIDNFDEPFADSSMIPTYYLSKVAREQVTVVLSGDGGDELFGGYNWYSWMLRLQQLQERLGLLARALPSLARMLPRGMAGRHLLSSLGFGPENQFLERISCFQADGKPSLYRPEFSAVLDGYDYGKVFRERFASYGGNLLQRMTKTDLNSYLPDDILTKVDRASMAVSLEARVPWLDHRLVEFAFSLPSDMRIKNGRKKRLPKELASKLLPKDLPVERKKGFCIPIEEWMRGQLGRMLERQLGGTVFASYIDKKRALDLLSRHRSDQRSRNGVRLFSVLLFLLWHQRYISNHELV
jgi:asparagine synthase (glutamine-hydrolysing)